MSWDFNPFTGTFEQVGAGGVSSSSDNFSYETIASGVTVTIPLYQQMMVADTIDVEGTLNVNGTLMVINV